MLLIGKLTLLALVSLTGLAFFGLVSFNTDDYDWALLRDPYFHAILWFSIKQALLSALLSVLLAWPVARALVFNPRLPLRSPFLSLCLLAFVLPTMVLITGMVVLFGRSGLLSPLLGESWNLYGLNGILIAHVYLNMPLAIRILVQQLNHIPDSSWRLARQLKMNPWQRLQRIEWPALRPGVLQLLGFIAVLCFNSFAVVLALGGGPQSSTLEVAIYQALKYDFNIPEALILAWTQLFVVGSFFLLLNRYSSMNWLSADTAVFENRPVFRSWRGLISCLVYLSAAVFLLLPLVALLPAVLDLDVHRFSWRSVIMPMLFTLLLGFTVSLFVVVLVYWLMQPIRFAWRRDLAYLRLFYEWLSTHTLLAPAMVLSVGLYILFLPRLDLDRFGWVFLVLLNIAVIIPFAVQQMRPRLLQFDAQYALLVDSLKLTSWQRLHVEWPFIKGVCYTVFALALVLAMGDVAIFSIFGPYDWPTLPWLIYRYASTYRLAEASFASLILLALSFMVIYQMERRSC
jgi:thiamine transport system permease protein